MDTPDLDRMTLLERAQQLHDSTLRRHGEMLDRHADSLVLHEDSLVQHAAHMARLDALILDQAALHQDLHAIALQLTARQDQHDEVMRHLGQTLDAIKDLLERGNGH